VYDSRMDGSAEELRQIGTHNASERKKAVEDLLASEGWRLVSAQWKERRADVRDMVLRHDLKGGAEERERLRQVFLALDEVLLTPGKIIDHCEQVLLEERG
jgi:hypothetical protein